MIDMITFTLPRADAGGLINLLGQMPTSSGVFPLQQALIHQFNNQPEPAPIPPPEPTE